MRSATRCPRPAESGKVLIFTLARSNVGELLEVFDSANFRGGRLENLHLSVLGNERDGWERLGLEGLLNKLTVLISTVLENLDLLSK